MKIAFLILVHRNPQLLMRCIRALASAANVFYIHLDAKADEEPFRGIRSERVTFIAPRLPVYWGEYSQVEATLALMQAALANAVRPDYLVLMQGSDYPIRSTAYIDAFLERHRGQEFISAVKIPAPGFPLDKIDKIRYPSTRPVMKLASRALARAGLARRDHRRFLGGLQAYAGDACWALSRAACEYVLQVNERRPELARYFRLAFTSDEMFFHTILANSRFADRIAHGLLYRDWPTPGDHPLTLSRQHVEMFNSTQPVLLTDQFGVGEALFARKFSDESLHLIDAIDLDSHLHFSSAALRDGSRMHQEI